MGAKHALIKSAGYVTPVIFAVIGVVVFWFFALPLPFLLGPIVFCLLAALIGVKMKAYRPLSDAMRTVLGLAIGTSLVPSVLKEMTSYGPSLGLLVVQTVFIGFIGIIFFHRICRYDFVTSYFSAMPGGLPDMVALGEEAGGNVRSISLLHATRVTVIVVGLPFLLISLLGMDLSNPPGQPLRDVTPAQLLLMFVAMILGWRIARYIGMFGAAILGPLLLSGALTLLGVITERPPAEVVWAAQFFIGMMIGTKYTGISLLEMRRDLFFGTIFAVFLLIVTAGTVALIQAFDLAPLSDAIMAFAPGGQAELVIIAIIIGADLPFVVAHHLLRLVGVILCANLIGRAIGVIKKPPE